MNIDLICVIHVDTPSRRGLKGWDVIVMNMVGGRGEDARDARMRDKYVSPPKERERGWNEPEWYIYLNFHTISIYIRGILKTCMLVYIYYVFKNHPHIYNDLFMVT